MLLETNVVIHSLARVVSRRYRKEVPKNVLPAGAAPAPGAAKVTLNPLHQPVELQQPAPAEMSRIQKKKSSAGRRTAADVEAPALEAPAAAVAAE
jgi:hypothetical protein